MRQRNLRGDFGTGSDAVRTGPLSRHTRGFTLLETLVCLTVISIGLLGLLKMEMAAVRMNNSSYLRGQAALLAYDILDRMRINSDVAEAGEYELALDTLPEDAPPVCVGIAAGCDTSQLARFDLAQWKCQLGEWNEHATCADVLQVRGPLPLGDGAITVDGTEVTVAVEWLDDRSETPMQTFGLVASL